ncbi:MAG: Elongation factor P [Calditrichaeota bacterium]|nr:Elongation factor P [Calditrichota bacterium]
MASTADFRNGMVIRFRGELYQIVEFQHVKPGKGGAFVRTKLKNVINGKVLDNTFRSGEKVEEIRLEARPMQYLYQEGDLHVFMDNETYEQIHMPAESLGDTVVSYLKEGTDYKMLYSEGTPLLVEPPTFMELTISDTEPGDKGDRVSAATKPATLETGAVIQVPMFIDSGETVKVDTRTNEYLERVK